MTKTIRVLEELKICSISNIFCSHSKTRNTCLLLLERHQQIEFAQFFVCLMSAPAGIRVSSTLCSNFFLFESLQIDMAAKKDDLYMSFVYESDRNMKKFEIMLLSYFVKAEVGAVKKHAKNKTKCFKGFLW